MNQKERKQIDSMRRRQQRLKERLECYVGDDPTPTLRELLAVDWLIAVALAADAAGLLEQLRPDIEVRLPKRRIA